MVKKVTILKLRENIQKLNDFYTLNYEYDDIYEGIHTE